MSAPTFSVGTAVWFKAAGKTPFVTGDPSDSSLEVGNQIGGRGKAAITLTPDTIGLGSVQGVPQIATADFPTPLVSQDGVTGTFPTGGQHLGVRDQITSQNPLAPGSVSTDGEFDGPTAKELYNPGNDGSGNTIDEGLTDRAEADTALRTVNPNFPFGQPNNSVAEGVHGSKSGPNPYGGGTKASGNGVDISGTSTVGRRTPSTEQNAGVVIEVVTTATVGAKSPDGTVIVAGNLYWVNWGPANASNPHKAKWYNRQRTTLHAEEDLVAA